MTDDWRTMTDAEREALPLGSPGWRYTRGSCIPKGQWIETFPERHTYPNGAWASKIRWASNGVGVPTMILLGSTKDVDPDKIEHKPGWYPLPPGAYRPFKPAKGDPAFAGLKAYKSR